MVWKNIFKKGSITTEQMMISSGKAVDALEDVVSQTTNEMDKKVSPFRQSFIQRYPTLFALFVTVGLVATFFGLEQIFLQIDIFVERPIVLLAFGLAILAVSGKLYKKLS